MRRVLAIVALSLPVLTEYAKDSRCNLDDCKTAAA
jgi:hypothetical protein